jgi:hypothetical protein
MVYGIWIAANILPSTIHYFSVFKQLKFRLRPPIVEPFKIPEFHFIDIDFFDRVHDTVGILAEYHFV